jgi:ribose 5-phosphate isomerase B
MNIILAADHAGFALKEKVKSYLQGKGLTVLDVGAHELKEGDDYPVYMSAAALKVAEDIGSQGRPSETKAIIFGGSGQGEAIVANRFPGVRAVVWYGGNEEIIRLSREHNDSNILSIGARFVNDEEAMKVVELWLGTSFSGEERHQRRNEQIDALE